MTNKEITKEDIGIDQGADENNENMPDEVTWQHNPNLDVNIDEEGADYEELDENCGGDGGGWGK